MDMNNASEDIPNMEDIMRKIASEDIIPIVPGCPTLNDSFLDLFLLSKITGVIQIFVCVFVSFAIIGCLFIFRNVHLKCVFNQIITA